MRRPDGSLAISIVAHLLLGAALVYLLTIGGKSIRLFVTANAPTTTERLTYVAVAPHTRNAVVPRPATPLPAPGPAPVPVKRQPVVRRTAPAVRPPAAPAPAGQPASGVPLAPNAAGRASVEAGGASGRAATGITPRYGNALVWSPPKVGAGSGNGESQSDQMDSLIAAEVQAHNDSIAAVTPGRAPGDWTFKKGGKKYGLDQHKIYFGSFAIPSAILALIPLRIQANPITGREDRALAFQHDEIVTQAERMQNEASFRDAVKEVRRRKQREHDDAERRRIDAGAARDTAGVIP